MVPLYNKYSLAVVERIREWFMRNVPEWSGFHTDCCMEYLDLWLVPSAADRQWLKILSKITSKVAQISETESSLSTSLRLHQIYVEPLTDYKFQVMPPGGDLTSTEQLVYTKITRVPHHSFSLDFVTSRRHFGFPRILPMRVHAVAAAVRTAWRTDQTWRSSMAMLRNAVGLDRPVLDSVSIMGSTWWPKKPLRAVSRRCL